MHVPRLLSRAAVLALLTVATASATAAPVRFNLVSPVTSTPVSGELTIRSLEEGKEPLRVGLQIPGSVELELGPGSYQTSCTAAGWWCSPQLVTISDGSIVDLPIRRSGTITGRAEGMSQRLSVRYEDPAEQGFTGEARCTFEGAAFRCELPEGKLDLRLGVPGHVPHYRLGVAVAAGRATDLGEARFDRGAAVSGRVATEGGALRNLRVTLGKIVVKPEANGFFCAGPVPPGDYTISASQAGLLSANQRISVREGLEAQLREPLVLSKPRTLRVNVSPPTDPLGEGWIAVLALGERGTETVSHGPVDAAGSWTAENLARGDYLLRIRPKRGPVWHVEEVAIADPVTSVHVAVKAVRFEANVKLGQNPLAATLIFNGERSATAIPFMTNKDGEARGYLPASPDGRWMVTVKSDEPQVHTTRIVEGLENAETRVVAIDIALADGTIAGEVLDERGTPVPHAIVSLVSDEAPSTTQVKTDESGAFSIRGIQYGRYAISAAGYLEESDTAEVEISAEHDSRELELRLKPYRQWRGRVFTPEGQPVREAKVFAVATDVPLVAAYPARTDHDGRFTALTPSAAAEFDVLVEPKGYSFSYFRRRLSEELEIVVDPRGGSIMLEFDQRKDVEPFLWHRGSAVAAFSLLSLWNAELEPLGGNKTRLNIPQMEPGEYTVCLMPSTIDIRTAKPGRGCKTIYLAPFATELVRLTNTSS